MSFLQYIAYVQIKKIRLFKKAEGRGILNHQLLAQVVQTILVPLLVERADGHGLTQCSDRIIS